MRLTLIILFLILQSSVSAFDTLPWQRLDADLTKVRYFPQNKRVFCIGTNGCLLHSEDKGITWNQSFTGTFNRLTSIDFISPLIGIVVGDNGIILRTIDGGITWNSIQSPTEKVLRIVSFASPTEGYIGGLNGTLLKTLDAGLSWQEMSVPFTFTISCIVMTSPNEGFIAGENATLLRTTDGGKSWQQQNIVNLSSGDYHFQGCVSANGTYYMYGGNDISEQGILVTTNDGINFVASQLPLVSDIAIRNDSIYTINTIDGISKADLQSLQFVRLPLADSNYSVSTIASNKYSLCFVDDNVAIAVGEHKFMYRGYDAMESWSLLSYLFNTNSYESIRFLNDSIGYLCGNSKHIYRTTNGGATWLPEKAQSAIIQSPRYIDFISPLHGFVLSNSGKHTVVETKDGGQSFQEKHSYMYVGEDLKMKCMDSSYCLIIGSYSDHSKGIVNISTDVGQSWQKKYFDNYITDLSFGGNSTILLSGVRTIFSNDKGITWDSTSFPFNFTSLGCWAIDAQNLLVTGSVNSHGIIVRSSDAGKTWRIIDTSENGSAFKISFSTPSHGYLLSRRLLHTTDGGYTWKSIADKSPVPNTTFSRMEALPNGNVIMYVFEPNNSIPRNAILLRSFFDSNAVGVTEAKVDVNDVASVWLTSPRPIPTSGKISIDASWVQNINVSTITLKLYDMLGLELNNITESLRPNSGTNTGIVEFDGSKLPTGIYYIEINGGGYRKAVPVNIAR